MEDNCPVKHGGQEACPHNPDLKKSPLLKYNQEINDYDFSNSFSDSHSNLSKERSVSSIPRYFLYPLTLILKDYNAEILKNYYQVV